MKVTLEAARLDIALHELEYLYKLLDDRIEDLYQVKGGVKSIHAYMFYRDKVCQAMGQLKTAIKSE